MLHPSLAFFDRGNRQGKMDTGCEKEGGENIQDAWVRMHVNAFDEEKVVARIIVVFDRRVSRHGSSVTGCRLSNL